MSPKLGIFTQNKNLPGVAIPANQRFVAQPLIILSHPSTIFHKTSVSCKIRQTWMCWCRKLLRQDKELGPCNEPSRTLSCCSRSKLRFCRQLGKRTKSSLQKHTEPRPTWNQSRWNITRFYKHLVSQKILYNERNNTPEDFRDKCFPL